MAGPTADVDERATHPAKPIDDGLACAEEPTQWPELTSVRVPGQLQVDAVPDRLVNRLGLVGHEDQRAAWVTALDGSREVRPMSNVEVRRLVVVDARQVKDLPGALDGDVLVAEDSEAELAQVIRESGTN